MQELSKTLLYLFLIWGAIIAVFYIIHLLGKIWLCFCDMVDDIEYRKKLKMMESNINSVNLKNIQSRITGIKSALLGCQVNNENSEIMKTILNLKNKITKVQGN
jgi:hypothetical protein